MGIFGRKSSRLNFMANPTFQYMMVLVYRRRQGTCIGDFGNKVLNKLVTQNPKWVLGFSNKGEEDEVKNVFGG